MTEPVPPAPRPTASSTPEAPAAVARRSRSRRLAVRTAALVTGCLVAANGAILLSVPAAQAGGIAHRLPGVDSINHFRSVDPKVWRGDAPAEEGYAELAARGVTTVVDLRAESEDVAPDLLHELGLTFVHIPVADGEPPTLGQVRTFLTTVAGSEGTVYVHCQAGVGRTGSMSAAYLVSTGQDTGSGALLRNLQVGPPSLEQIVYAGTLDERLAAPPGWVSALSLALDGPRLLWGHLRRSL